MRSMTWLGSSLALALAAGLLCPVDQVQAQRPADRAVAVSVDVPPDSAGPAAEDRGPPAQARRPENAGPPDEAGPALADRGPPAQARRPENAGPPDEAGNAVEDRGPPAQAGPPNSSSGANPARGRGGN